MEYDYEMEYEYTGFWAEEETHDETQNDLHGDYADDVTQYEAIPLNTAAETEFDGLNEADERNIAEAAFMAFRKR